MANDQQFRTRTGYVATRGVKEYRETIPHVVSESDSVLELGCEWGTTTQLLARRAGLVIGADVSRGVVAARAWTPSVPTDVGRWPPSASSQAVTRSKI